MVRLSKLLRQSICQHKPDHSSVGARARPALMACDAPVWFADFQHDPSLSYGKAMIAGATAGVAEHIVMYPVDTIKTLSQVQTAARPSVLQVREVLCVPASAQERPH